MLLNFPFFIGVYEFYKELNIWNQSFKKNGISSNLMEEFKIERG